jgi:hypothetical protein
LSRRVQRGIAGESGVGKSLQLGRDIRPRNADALDPVLERIFILAEYERRVPGAQMATKWLGTGKPPGAAIHNPHRRRRGILTLPSALDSVRMSDGSGTSAPLVHVSFIRALENETRGRLEFEDGDVFRLG